MKLKARYLSLFALLMLVAVLTACTSATPTLTILHAGSLSVPFKHVSEEFNKLYPNVKIEMESAGSRTTIRKVTELGKQADIVGSADYKAIEQLMFPKFSDWYVKFARNQMGLMYTEHSKYANEINNENWYDILTRDGVEYGHSDPDADPCGYRTLLVFQLAEKHYGVPGLADRLDKGCPQKNIRPKETELLALLESGDLDYAFIYKSVAAQHSLKFLELPVEIDLSGVDYADLYANAKVEIAGKEPGTTQTQVGAPIVYGITIPKNAPNPDLAKVWVKFLLSPEGRAVLEKDGQPPIVPALAKNIDNVPAELKALAQE